MRPSKKILVLTPQFPYPPQQGTTLRNFNLIAGLAARHRVALLSFGEQAAGHRTPLEGHCHSVQVVAPPRHTTARRLRGIFASNLPDMALRLASPHFRAALAEMQQREAPDIIQVEGIELAPYLLELVAERPAGQRPLIVFDDHNAEYVLQQRAFETDVRHPGRWAGAAYSLVQWRRLRAYERQACLAADRVVAVSETDARALRRLVPALTPAVVPNGVDLAYYTSALPETTAEEGPSAWDLVFTGKMDFRPNVDAVLWFAQAVLPVILRDAPQARFWVVGRDPHRRLEPLRRDPAVTVTGRVEDTRPYFASAGVYVIPLRIGGGTRLKVLEAMAMSKAIVSTSLGCEGFDVVSGRELMIADSPEEFAAAVITLIRDPDLRQRLGHAAREFAESRYDWRSIIPLLERVYEI
jgi:polysaccharide biosynthesis protein PslH